MGSRMLCTECFDTAPPATRFRGSDGLELFGWLCGAVPGLLYSAWRHMGRERVCHECGGDNLIRESRRAAARFAPPVTRRAPDSPTLRASPWPGPLSTPRARLLHGSVALVALSTLGSLAPDLGVGTPGLAAVWACGPLACASWRRVGTAQRKRSSTFTRACRAWDERGQPLEIELL